MRGVMFGVAVLAAIMVLPVTACTPSGGSTATTVAAPESSAVSTLNPSIPPPPPLPKPPAGKSRAQIVEGIVLTRSKKLGAALDASEWRNLSSTICRDLAAGGTGLYLSKTAAALPAKDQWEFADLYLDGALEGTCQSAEKPAPPPSRYYGSHMQAEVYSELTTSLIVEEYESRRLLNQYVQDVRAYGRTYGVDVSHLLATVPGGSRGSGYDVVCADGWVSSSGGKQGACSHHGGVG